jgi:hypothetical protein
MDVKSTNMINIKCNFDVSKAIEKLTTPIAIIALVMTICGSVAIITPYFCPHKTLAYIVTLSSLVLIAVAFSILIYMAIRYPKELTYNYLDESRLIMDAAQAMSDATIDEITHFALDGALKKGFARKIKKKLNIKGKAEIKETQETPARDPNTGKDI